MDLTLVYLSPVALTNPADDLPTDGSKILKKTESPVKGANAEDVGQRSGAAGGSGGGAAIRVLTWRRLPIRDKGPLLANS